MSGVTGYHSLLHTDRYRYFSARRDILRAPRLFMALIASLLLTMTACKDQGADVDKGFKDMTNLNLEADKEYSIAGWNCGPSENCIAVYYSGRAGSGFIVEDGAGTLKVYRALGDDDFTATCNGGSETTIPSSYFSVSQDPANSELYDITINTDFPAPISGSACNAQNGDTVKAQKY